MSSSASTSEPCFCDGCRPVRVRSVAIIGAGAVGLAALKCILDERYFDGSVVCFEASQDIGGVWVYREDHGSGSGSDPQAASAYKSLRTNSSRDMMGYSDFPLIEHDPKAQLYSKHDVVLHYLQAYARKHSLLDYIQFHSRVLSCHRRGSQWLLTVRHRGRIDRIEKYSFDAVMFCTGQFSQPAYAPFADKELFTGLVLHAHDYRSPEMILNHERLRNIGEPINVVVIGIGNSAGDIALELAQQPKDRISVVNLVIRSGAYLIDISGSTGSTDAFDVKLHTRRFIQPQFRKERRSYFSNRALHTHKPFVAEGFPEPSPNLEKAHVTLLKNPQDWLTALKSRRIIVHHGTVARVSGERKIELSGGTTVKADVIVHCTGYTRTLPQLDDDVASRASTLHRHVLHRDYATLAVMAQIDSQGSVFSVGEMQARWLARLWSGRAPTPCVKTRQEWCNAHDQRIAREQPAYPLFVDYVSYLDSFAREIGCKPRPRTKEEDPGLSSLLECGTVYPATYRLDGPHPWSGAHAYLAKL